MVRLFLTLVLAVALTGAALAAADTFQAERQYVDRVLTMEDTAAAHVALAQWCDNNGLPDRARVHWQEALHRDSENKEARAALGYVKRGMEWVQVTQAPASPRAAAPTTVEVGGAATQDATLGPRRQVFVKNLQSLTLGLSTTDPQAWEAARAQVLAMRDTAAAEPIARILGAGPADQRKLACEALGQIPGDEAGRLLVKFLLADESGDVAQAAAAALAKRTEARGVPQLVNALNGSEKVLNRSAYALGEMREWRAVPALIGHLLTPETRVYEVPAPPESMARTGSYFFSGQIVPYIANVRPIVGPGVVAWKPIIGYIPVGTGIVVQNPVATIQRTVIEWVPQPAVREALQKITGQDFEYNSQDWRNWVDKNPPPKTP